MLLKSFWPSQSFNKVQNKKIFIPFPQLLYSPFLSLISKHHVLSSCPRNTSFVLICLCLSAQHQIITCHVVKSTGAITWLHFTYSRHFAENTSAASLIFHQSESERMQRNRCKTKETARQEVDVQSYKPYIFQSIIMKSLQALNAKTTI